MTQLLIAIGLFAFGQTADRSPAERLADALAKSDSAVAIRASNGPEAQRLFRQALEQFDALIHDGYRSGGLYYNIGNTYVRLGDVGRAIVAYRRAQRLAPTDDRIRKNLDVARRMCDVTFEKPATSALIETLLFWHFNSSPRTRMTLGLTAYGLAWLALLARLFVRGRSPALRWAALTLGTMALCCGASIGWEQVAAANRLEGVTVTDKVVLRKGNGDYYDPQFDRPLPAGVEFRVLESRADVKGGQWHHIELADGKSGWLRADQCDVI